MKPRNIGTFFSQRPWLISLLILIGLSFWLGLGVLNAQEEPLKDSVQGAEKTQQAPLAKVQYETFQSLPVAKKIDLYGRTAPDKQAKLSAEVSGRVVALFVKKGESVKKNQPIAQIDKADLEIQLERARANLRVKDKEFNAAKSLKNRGLQGEVAYSSAQASLIEARALVKNAQLNLKNTQIVAPFDGIIDNLMIELGDFVGVGEPVATIVDLNVLVVKAEVNERHIRNLELNQKAIIRLVDDEQLEGTLRYISKTSSTATNTFPIEIEVANSKPLIPAGISAEVELKLEMIPAIKISPAMLALDESGNLGVKTLKNDVVHFIPIQLVKTEQDGVWLSGLSSSVDIITLGQGFVRDGDAVIAVKRQSFSSQTDSQ